MSDSVGKISLDLEVTSDLENQIGKVADKISKGLKNATDGAVKSAMSSVKDSVDKGVNNVNNSIKSGLNKTGDTIKKTVSNIFNSLKNIKMPSFKFEKPTDESIPKSNVKSQTSGRSPPKANTNMNTEALKAQIDNVSAILDNTNARIEQQKEKLAQLRESYKMAFNPELKNNIEDKILKTEALINDLIGKSDKLGFKLVDLDKKFESLGSTGSETTSKLGSLKEKISEISNSTNNTSNKTSGLINKTRSLGSASNSASSGTNNYRNSIGNLMRQMMTWMIILPGISKGITAMASLMYRACMTNSQFATSLQVIKSNLWTAFAPIYTAILPAINTLMNALATLTSYVASFISALFGKTYQQSFNSAKALQSSIGAYDMQTKAAEQAATSLTGAGNAAEKAGNKAKKAKEGLMGFDEINKLNDKNSSNSESTPKTPGSGVVAPITPVANMAPIEATTATWAEKFKSILAGLWKPFKEAWSVEGVNTINAAKHALQGIENLIGSIGKSFYTVWTNGTGTKILRNILKILQDILNIIGDIGNTFATAWNKGNIGTQVVQHLANAFNNILGLIDQMLQSLRKVFQQEGPTLADFFMQALNGTSGVIENLTQKLRWIWDHGGQHCFEGFVRLGAKIGELALFIYNNFVIPFANWFINTIMPAISPLLDIIGTLFDKLSDLINWLMGSGKPVLDVIVVAVTAFAASWKGVTLAIKAFVATQNLFDKFKSSVKIMQTLVTGKLFLIVAAITAVITIGVLLYKNWDVIKKKAKELWDSVKKKFNEFKEWLGNIFTTDWSKKFGVLGNVFNAFLKNISNIWNSIKKVFSGIINFVKGVFTGNWKQAWQGVKEIFRGIMSGLGAVIKAPLNVVIALINGAIDGINSISFTVPSWVPGLGGFHFGASLGKIPYLARGGIVDNPTLAMVGEHGKEAVMPLEHNTGWISTLADKLASRMPQQVNNTNASDRPIEIILQIDNTKFGKAVVNSYNKLQKQEGRLLFDL